MNNPRNSLRPFFTDPDDVVSIELTEDERKLLVDGLWQWGGPARCTPAFAVAMEFGSLDEFEQERNRLVTLLEQGEPLTRFDWRRTLLATEIVFASNAVGAGLDWSICTGWSDEETIRILRPLQRKLLETLLQRLP